MYSTRSVSDRVSPTVLQTYLSRVQRNGSGWQQYFIFHSVTAGVQNKEITKSTLTSLWIWEINSQIKYKIMLFQRDAYNTAHVTICTGLKEVARTFHGYTLYRGAPLTTHVHC